MVRVNLKIFQKLIFASFFYYKYNTEPSIMWYRHHSMCIYIICSNEGETLALDTRIIRWTP